MDGNMDSSIVEPTPAVPASHGRACINCARAKAKCITTSNTADNIAAQCQRCQRLKKECAPSPPTRKRRTVKNMPVTKTARLEEKLDGLVSLLQSASQSLPVAPLPQMELSLEVVHTSPQNFGPSSTEAEESLRLFRSHFAKHIPFIPSIESTTAHDLRQTRPFLWFSMMAVTSKSSVQQMALGKELRLAVAQRTVVEGERSLDLLLGLLVYLAWGQSYSHSKTIVSSLIQLAFGLSVDLGLNKPPSKEPQYMMLNYDARGCPKFFNPSTRTIEERRALITCFLLGSVISSYFQRIESPRWTPYFDECLRILAENAECPSDVLLAHLVRLQLIVEKIAQIPWYEGSTELTNSIRTPASFYIKALEKQLQDFKRDILSKLEGNETILLYFYNTEISLYEIALSQSAIFPNDPSFRRLDSLYACLYATKSWFDIFLAIPPAHYIGFPTSMLTQMAHCIIVLYRLSTFDDQDWDLGLVKQALDFPVVLDQLIQRISQVRIAAAMRDDGTEENNIFCGTKRRLEAIRSWWDVRVDAELGRHEKRVVIDNADGVSMNSWDDSWLDIFGIRELQF